MSTARFAGKIFVGAACVANAFLCGVPSLAQSEPDESSLYKSSLHESSFYASSEDVNAQASGPALAANSSTHSDDLRKAESNAAKTSQNSERESFLAQESSVALPSDAHLALKIPSLTQKSVLPVHSNLAVRPQRQLLGQIRVIADLPPSDRELAEELEIWDLLVELHDSQHPPDAARREVLRAKIHETIVESYLDVASVQAEANREAGLLDALRDTALDKRDRSVDRNNAANFIASGTLNTVGSVLGFTNTIPPFPGNLNQMLSGVVSTSMSTYAMKQGAGGKTVGFGKPTLLAELFGRPSDERTGFPESVWRFLHGHSIDHKEKSRAQVLEDYWIDKKHLEKHGSKREQLKLDIVCGVPMKKKVVTIDDMNDQIHMINDIGSTVARMAHHLRDLICLIDTDVI